jgi:1-deoxy-D-xylulose-5-phosphate synthase
MAEARCRKGESHKVIAVIGDGALGSGLAWEGLNQTGHLKKHVIVILNDNEMSISPNVGAFSSYLSRIITGHAYNVFRSELKAFLQTLPGIVGKSFLRIAKQSEEFFKGLFVPGIVFEELGFKYFGPIPGHRIDFLVETLRNVKHLDGPSLIHVVTTKGKGYPPAEEDPVTFHGVGPFEATTGECRVPESAPPTYTQVFGEAMITLASRDESVVSITAGMAPGTGLDGFAQRFPERFYDVGIAEPHAVTFAAGLAVEGLRPVIAIYSTFLQRAYDQVLHDICAQNLPVVFALDRAGIVGEDGPTHHGLFDLSYLRHIPNLTIMAPKDENELQHMLKTALSLSGPAVIRYPRGRGHGVPLEGHLKTLPTGRAEILREGSDVVILAIGSTVMPAKDAAERLSDEGIEATVVNCRFVKPLDGNLIGLLTERIGKVITVEENVVQGGFGSAVKELLDEEQILPSRSKALGITDVFVEHGKPDVLRKRFGIDSEGIFQAAREICKETLIRLPKSIRSG